MSDFEAVFGTGILSQGEMFTSAEHHRLFAKKSWLALADYFRLNDELIKLVQIPIPWSLDKDSDIQDVIQGAYALLARYAKPESYEDYVVESEFFHHAPDCKRLYDRGFWSDRLKWIESQVTSENPRTVLDVGIGLGNVSRLLADQGFMVTGVCPNKPLVEYLNELTEEDSVEFVGGALEVLDFGERRFDTVIASEVLEHVAADRPFLRKCLDIAERSVIVTTPVGSTEYGFYPNADWRENLQHVRAYSETSFKQLISDMGDDFEISGPIEIKAEGGSSYNAHTIPCFCCKLVRTKEFSDEHSDRNRSRAPHGSEARSG